MVMKNFDWLFKTPIAHRGLHDEKISENSIPSYELAISKGYNIEIDVRLTRDKEIVVFHDDTLSRLCNLDKRVDELDYSDIQNIRLPHGERIPRLNEVLDCVSSRSGLLIELKSNGNGTLEEGVNDMLHSYKGDFAVQSFHPFSIRWFKTHAERVPRGLLATYDKLPIKCYESFLLRHLILLPYCKPDFLSYDEAHIERRRIRRLKIPKLAWTVRDMSRAKAILENNLADNVIFESFEP